MQIIKRLALGIPTLIFISSVVFFLSKVMPGDSGAYLLEDNMQIGTKAQQETRERIYLSYLERTGQDKPLFYFSLESLAEPDTLYKIYPVSHQLYLKKLCHNYGNWSYINDYYKALVRFRNVIQEQLILQDATSSRSFSTLTLFFDATSQDQIKTILKETEAIVSSLGSNHAVKKSFVSLKSKYAAMESHKQGYKKFIPKISWYGADNQYHLWLSNLMTGDMGKSLRNSRPVSGMIGEALGVTLLLTISSLLLGWVISLIIAVIINLPEGAKLEGPVLTFLYILDTLPLFLISFLILIFFSGGDLNGLLPSFGLGNYELIENYFVRLVTLLKHLVLPIFCMTLVILPYLIGQIDRALKEVKKFEYIKTAKAKGLSNLVVLHNHVLRNAWTPLITIFTENLPSLISGALVVEVIFAIPGMGRLLMGAVNGRDYPVVLGIVVLVAMVKIISNILADVLYRFADPRIKLSK